METEIIFVNANRRKGCSTKNDKSGKPYDRCVITHLVPIENTTGTKGDPDKDLDWWRYVGFGMETREIDLSPESLDQFSKVEPLTKIRVQLEPQPRNLGRLHVVGYE